MSLRTRGFTIIELVIAITLASLLMIAVYRAFNQINRTAIHIESLFDYTQVMPLVYNQLEKDISAAFVPLRGYPPEEKKEEKKPTDMLITGTATAPEVKPKKIEKVFYSTNDHESLKLMTFISTNPLLGYGQIAPRIVRVTYRLVPDKNSENLFILTREESTDLSAQALDKNTRGYEILRDLKTIKVRFWGIKEEEQEKKDNKKEEKKKKEYVEFTEWGTDEQQKKTKKLVPNFVMLDGVVWDNKRKREQQFSFMYEIFAHEGKPAEAEKKAPEPAQKTLPNQQPAAPIKLSASLQQKLWVYQS